jgi:hypothetical protein
MRLALTPMSDTGAGMYFNDIGLSPAPEIPEQLRLKLRSWTLVASSVLILAKIIGRFRK